VCFLPGRLFRHLIARKTNPEGQQVARIESAAPSVLLSTCGCAWMQTGRGIKKS
jgi:hypothetical protein